MKIFALALVGLLLFVSAAQAEMYIYTDKNGRLLITDKPYMEEKMNSTGNSWQADRVFKHELFVRQVSAKYMVDAELIKAVIYAESKYNEHAVSKAGAMGLMQLMPLTAKHLGVEDPFDPQQNIEGGVRYLRYLLERFGGNVEYAVAAYNAGPGNVDKYGGVPPFGETRRYIKRIFERYNGNKNMYIPTRYKNTIKRVMLKDGTVLYTNQQNFLSTKSRF
jgi:soluble lytic murein transglycosylase-like protein